MEYIIQRDFKMLCLVWFFGQKIFDMFMAGYTQEDIAKEVNMPQKTVDDHLKVLANIDKCPKSLKLSAQFQDPDFKVPLYNLWSYGKLTNGTPDYALLFGFPE